MWKKWIPLVAVITFILIAKEWNNIRKANREELILGIIAAVITFVIMTLGFAFMYWAAEVAPRITFGLLTVFLIYRFIKVHKGKKHGYKRDSW